MIVVALVYGNAERLFADIALLADDTADLLALAARGLLLPGLTLLAGIIVAARRGFIADAIDGARA